MAKQGSGDNSGEKGRARRKTVATGRKDPVPSIGQEPDPAWRIWFDEVARRKAKLSDAKAKPVVASTVERNGIPITVFRRKSEPLPLARFLKQGKKKAGRKLSQDLEWIRSAWGSAVGVDIAGATEIHSFKNGILTITVSSSILLQEIRQFHQEAILGDLRDIWQASVPLVKILYRSGS